MSSHEPSLIACDWEGLTLAGTALGTSSAVMGSDEGVQKRSQPGGVKVALGTVISDPKDHWWQGLQQCRA